MLKFSMCGRISTANLSAASLKAHFRLTNTSSFTLSYNVAPTLKIPAIREYGKKRWLESLRWGLIPYWAKDKEIAHHTFNARIETLTEKPSFREAIQSKRCIIVASGFYEWQKQEKTKQPFYIYRADKRPVAMAGLWDHWLDNDSGDRIESCSIISMPATYLLAEIHERMPAILEPEHFDIWLDHRFRESRVLQDILKAEKHTLEMYPVSRYMSNSNHDGEKCIERFQ